ncbi:MULTISPECIES: hypothetical protein [unclassified Rhodosalinus]|uniref:hypothetical protein n=1 Tax=unclassified Rhodosalinus TaxID=2630183 RepID=UPI003525BEF9
MDDHALKGRILAFARHCGAAANDPKDIAHRRGWLDAAGAPTKDGAALIAALDGQEATRSVYRGVL